MSQSSLLRRKLAKQTLYDMYQSRLPQVAHAPGAEVFFVGGTGASNTKMGTVVTSPFATIKYALSKCVAYRQDIIYVHPTYWTPSGEDWPIAVSKAGVHITGLASQRYGQYPFVVPDGDYATFHLYSAGQTAEISHMALGGGDAHGCIDLGGTGRFWVHHCLFGSLDIGETPQDGIRSVQGTVNVECLIENNVFIGDLGYVVGKITRNGVQAQGTNIFRHSVIRDNLFLGLEIGIKFGSCVGVSILDNKFKTPAAQNGEAITLAAGAEGCLIDGNSATCRKGTGMPVNPFIDASTHNAWGLNYRGGVLGNPGGA